MFKRTLLALALMTAATFASADPVRFNFTFQEPQGAAQAVGYVVLETDLIANPGAQSYIVPSAAVLDLSVTVTGASSGNGTFGVSDFCEIVFDTGGGTLNFAAELVGQPTANQPWGSIPDVKEATSGDFNLFSVCNAARYEEGSAHTPTGATAPNGVWYFTLGADGGGANEMQLVSMIAAAGTAPVRHPVPAANFWTLAGLLVLTAGFGIAALRARSA